MEEAFLREVSGNNEEGNTNKTKKGGTREFLPIQRSIWFLRGLLNLSSIFKEESGNKSDDPMFTTNRFSYSCSLKVCGCGETGMVRCTNIPFLASHKKRLCWSLGPWSCKKHWSDAVTYSQTQTTGFFVFENNSSEESDAWSKEHRTNLVPVPPRDVSKWSVSVLNQACLQYLPFSLILKCSTKTIFSCQSIFSACRSLRYFQGNMSTALFSVNVVAVQRTQMCTAEATGPFWVFTPAVLISFFSTWLWVLKILNWYSYRENKRILENLPLCLP